MASPGEQRVLCNIDLGGFKTVGFESHQVHMVGGHLRSHKPMTTRAGISGTTYVLLNLSQHWLIAATTGSTKYITNMFGRHCLLDEFREWVMKACDGEVGTTQGNDDDAKGDEYDPMNEVECETGGAGDRTQTRGHGVTNKRARHGPNKAKNKLLNIDFRVHPLRSARTT